MINIQKIILKFKFQKCRNYAYIWKGEKKNATILNLYNNLNLMQHVTGILWNVGVHLYFNILGYVQISKSIMVYLHSQKKKKLWYI